MINSRLFTKIVIIILFLTINSLYPQWLQTSGPIAERIRALAIKDSFVFAGTEGHIYVTSDNGLNWTQTSLNCFVNDLAVCDSIICAATTTGIFVSSNNGQNWTQTLNSWSNGIAANDSVIFAGGTGMYKSTNNGQTWTQTTLGGQIVSILINGSNIFAGFAYGYQSNGGVYFSSNNGQSWESRGLSSRYVLTLAMNGSIVFAGTIYGTGLFKSTNNGLNWSLTSLNCQEIWALKTSGSNVFAGTFNPSGFYQSTDTGQTWIPRNEGLGIQTVLSITLVSNNIFAGTVNNRVWKRNLSELSAIELITNEIPEEFSLSQNYPNPFNPVTNIKFDIPKSGLVKITVYDMLGREVISLVNQQMQPGSYNVVWDASNFPSGVYFYKIDASDFTVSKKMVLVK